MMIIIAGALSGTTVRPSTGANLLIRDIGRELLSATLSRNLSPFFPDFIAVSIFPFLGIRQEIWYEKFAVIEKAKKNNPNVTNGVKEIFPDAEATTMPNSWFHEDGYQGAKFIVRTGALMPWGNVALFSGIPVVE